MLSPLMIFPLWFKKGISSQIFPIWLTTFIGSIFWMFSAPDFRFGYGFLIPTSLLAILPWGGQFKIYAKLIDRFVYVAIEMVLLVFLALTLIGSIELHTIADRLNQPADYDHVPTQTCDLAQGQVFCARNFDACAYNDFPCIPVPRAWVQMRGTSFEDGFRVTP